MAYRYYGSRRNTKDLPKKHKFAALKLPDVIDLSMYRPYVINQGSVGRCTGCSSGGALSGKMSQLGLNPGNTFIFSPDDLYNGGRELEGTLAADDGAELADVYTWAQLHGVLPYGDMPMTPTLSTVDPLTLESEAVTLPAFDPAQIDTSVDAALANILDAMAAGNFIVVGSVFFALWESYTGGVMPLQQTSDPVGGEHAYFLYKADNTKQIIYWQNSWGTDNFGQNNPDKGCGQMPFAQIPILARMGMDAHYATFTAPQVVIPPNPPPAPPAPPKGCCRNGLRLIKLYVLAGGKVGLL